MLPALVLADSKEKDKEKENKDRTKESKAANKVQCIRVGLEDWKAAGIRIYLNLCMLPFSFSLPFSLSLSLSLCLSYSLSRALAFSLSLSFTLSSFQQSRLST